MAGFPGKEHYSKRGYKNAVIALTQWKLTWLKYLKQFGMVTIQPLTVIGIFFAKTKKMVELSTLFSSVRCMDASFLKITILGVFYVRNKMNLLVNMLDFTAF